MTNVLMSMEEAPGGIPEDARLHGMRVFSHRIARSSISGLEALWEGCRTLSYMDLQVAKVDLVRSECVWGRQSRARF